jgi:hypothetical protein
MLGGFSTSEVCLLPELQLSMTRAAIDLAGARSIGTQNFLEMQGLPKFAPVEPSLIDTKRLVVSVSREFRKSRILGEIWS